MRDVYTERENIFALGLTSGTRLYRIGYDFRSRKNSSIWNVNKNFKYVEKASLYSHNI